MELIFGYLLIFSARIVDVSISVVRTLLMVRGKKIQAACLGCIEVFIYITVLTKIMGQLDNLGNLIAYSLGFGTGQIVGIFIEQKMALGDATVQVITKEDESQLVELLRGEGFGVTVIPGYGKNGVKQILHIALKRNMLPKFHEIMEEFDKDAFITVMDTKSIRGGYMQRLKRK
ncbi:DUF2179 domain-containing protein [Thermotalea metallivorans]|uniref:UPF0316 protein AN619_10440 n=1 Tax=Thermotalea metallivorans TaxID=520762 RepID=A0A140L7I8_9FIRM|nr:DUF5698 domain-containing protein [Thermotalea metallivorans]KXG76513.1 hypothetical protein AN619_10440 [Thermotalea metallivorans]